MRAKYIEEVRAFSRFYTVFFGILNRRFLKSRYTLVETRVMHAVYEKQDITPSEIVAALNIDKGYLSRLLASLEKRKAIAKIGSKEDGRSVHLRITPFGKQEFEKLTRASNKQVEQLLSRLTDAECRQLVRKMQQIIAILGTPPRS